MVKVTLPMSGYDDPRYHPIWAAAEELRLPVLFHTGVVTVPGSSRGQGISAWHMHPMRIEPITREFPDLGIIAAHLGIHWNTDAAELARMCPNVYVDLTGEPDGWRRRADMVGVDQWLWWPGAWDKVVFGTDVHYTKFERILREDVCRLDRYGVADETRERIFHGNIERLLGCD